MNPLFGLIVMGIVLCMAAVLVWGGHSADGMRLSMPVYLQVPLALILACAGVFFLLWGFKKSWRENDMMAFVVGGVTVLYLISIAFE